MAEMFHARTCENVEDAQTAYYKSPKPILDEGQIEEMEWSLLESFENNLLIEITSWKKWLFTSRVGGSN